MELVLLALLAAACAIGHLPVSAVAIELVANAGFQIGVVALVAGAWWMVHPLTRRYGGFALALAAIQLVPALRLHLPAAPGVATGPTLRLASVNLLFGNEDPRSFHTWLGAERPDVIALLEISPTWKRVLELERSLLPHQYVVDVTPALLGSRSFAIGVGSRHPIGRLEVRGGTRGDIPWLDVEIAVDDRPLRVIVVHAMGPRQAAQLRARNSLFEDLAAAIEDSQPAPRPTCLLGDFNATLYSQDLSRLISRADLRDARSGQGREPSWFPFRHSACGLLAIDLDHAFVTAGIQIASHRIGPDIGSDHRPVVVDVRLP